MKKIIITVSTIMIMLFGFCACGESEEVVEITSATQQATEAEKTDTDSDYKKIYEEYYDKMSEATDKYIEELKAEADDVSKDKLYDLTREKTDALNEIREEGNGEMTDVMLATSSDDSESYEKWFKKLGTAFTEFSGEITKVYTDRF